MYDEAVSTFEYIVRENRPVSDMLYADYTFLNPTLAKFYGVSKEIGSRDAAAKNLMVKVDGPTASIGAACCGWARC